MAFRMALATVTQVFVVHSPSTTLTPSFFYNFNSTTHCKQHTLKLNLKGGQWRKQGGNGERSRVAPSGTFKEAALSYKQKKIV